MDLPSVLAELSTLEQRLSLILEDNYWADNEKVEMIQSCQSGLRFLKMFLCSLLTWEDTSDAEIRRILNRICDDTWGISSTSRNRNWIQVLHSRIQTYKHKFEEPCEHLLWYSLRCPLNNTSSRPTEYLAAILQNLKDLYMFKTADEIRLLNNQIVTLTEKVTLLHNLFKVTPNQWGDFNEMRAFYVDVHAFAQNSASLVFLYWVKAVDDGTERHLNILLVNVLLNYEFCVKAFKAVYIRFLDEMKSRQLDSFLSGQIVQAFLDILLENLTLHIPNEDFKIIQESLFFVISFLANPPEHVEDEELMTLSAEIEHLVKQDLCCVLSVDDMKGGTCLGDFKRKAELVKGKIKQVYARSRDSFSYDFPKINGLGFFDFLLQNLSFLKEKLIRDTDFIPFAKHLIIQIEEELMSLRPYLDDLFQRQNEDKELTDTWLNIMDLVYKTEYAINSSSVPGFPLWYKMARLMEVLDVLKDVKSNLKNIEGRKTRDGATRRCLSVGPSRVREGPSASSFNEVMVGLEEEADKIVEKLINGSKSLDIVAIVGMPGLGKTTMANKVYNAPAIRSHFHIFAYCTVSQVYGARRILLDILGDIRGKDDNLHEMMVDDLADMLRKCLLGKRFLIVMDDIWDVKSWNEIRSSIPNNRNGSKVIFTTRIQNVAKEDCYIHLRFLSNEESWELLRKKALQAEGCPSDLLEVGKMIAYKCKGLPLTIVLIAGLLRTETSLRWWNKVSEAVSSYVFTEDVMSVLELSYQHLPEHLKPCFLYFGAFEEGKLIRVNKLTLLWIAEGFVLNSIRGNLENVAKEYLSDLVDRSLVIVDKRSSYGGIKRCRIHDLVHEFCKRKAQEENIFQLKVNNEASYSSSSTLSNPYRLCIHSNRAEFDARNICPGIRSLLLNCRWRLNGHGRYDLSNLKLVQVMDLEALDHDAYFMREMHSLVNLRFLSISCALSGCGKSNLNDDFVFNRWNLKILILSETAFGYLPETFWNMIMLRHVDVRQCSLRTSGVKRHDPHPQMVNLESFSTLRVSSTEELEVLLRRSPSLRKLSFYCIPHKNSIHFPNVDSLSRLESLNVNMAGKACFCSFNLLSSLKKLSLTYVNIDWRYSSVICKMPCLEVLKLLQKSFVGRKWDMEDTEFPKLKYLKLQYLELAEWIATVESFPSLEVLIVDGCHRLKTIPPCFGEMLILKRIEVHRSSNAAASVVEIHEAQKDFGNEELRVSISSTPMFEYDGFNSKKLCCRLMKHMV